MGAVPDPKTDTLAAELHTLLTDRFLPTINIEESTANVIHNTLSHFQVDLKQNRLRSTKPVAEVSKTST